MGKTWQGECPGCKLRLFGPVEYCPFCGKPVEEISPPSKGPVIKGLSISALGESGRVVVTAIAHSEDGLTVKRAEYWIGNDPGPGNGTGMKAVEGSFNSSRVDITGAVDIRELKEGKYSINVRSADVRGEWGSPQTTILTVPTREETKQGGDEETVETEVGDTGGPSSPESPTPPPTSGRHLLRNVFVCIAIAACLFIGYKIISKERDKAQLSVSTSPTGASLTIDGQNKGRTPAVGISIDPGPHRIVLEKDGYSRTVRDISLVPREKKSLKISLSISKPPPPKPSGKERAEELVGKGASSEEAGKLDEALLLYREAREIYPDLPRINELIINVQTKIRAQRREERVAQQRIKAEGLVSQGASSEGAGKFEEALSLYREAREIYPDLPRINKLIADVQGKIEEQKGGKQSGGGDGKKGIEDDLKEAIGAFNNSQYDVAIKMCQSILRKDPNNSTAQQYLQKAKEEQERAIKNALDGKGSIKKIK